MRFTLLTLELFTRKTIEAVNLSSAVTYLHGPVSTGKSSVVRLIDFCLGGGLERTPALRKEFVAARLTLLLGGHTVVLDRSAEELGSVRVTWSDDDRTESVNAPLQAGDAPIYEDAFNLSDLIFVLAGIQPMKVRKSKADPDSPLVRLSFRDVMWYCYLEQDHLDSSFFHLADPIRKYKSRDVMRFITGLYSERLSELESTLERLVDQQRIERETVERMKTFMAQFQLASESDVVLEIQKANSELESAQAELHALDQNKTADTHAVEPMRAALRALSAEIDQAASARSDLLERVNELEGVRSQLVTAKMKAARISIARDVLGQIEFEDCPSCGQALDAVTAEGTCRLCHKTLAMPDSLAAAALNKDLDDRIDDVKDLLAKHKVQLTSSQGEASRLAGRKRELDDILTRELARYDSAFMSQVRAVERRTAELSERRAALEKMRAIPAALARLQAHAGRLQGDIDKLRSEIANEKKKLESADGVVGAIQDEFLKMMRTIRFPGVEENDSVVIDTRDWLPYVIHQGQKWTFYGAGSGGKKTLFNVCYALAIHRVAMKMDLPLPTFLMVDSPTKNISQDENPTLVTGLYAFIYSTVEEFEQRLQFVLVDSDFVRPSGEPEWFSHRRLGSGEAEAPALIPYYVGP